MDEGHEFVRLKQSMEMVGFSSETQRRIFSVLTAVLHLGNVEYKKVDRQTCSFFSDAGAECLLDILTLPRCE